MLLVIQKLKRLGLSQPCGAISISPVGDNSWQTALKTLEEDGIVDAMLGVCPSVVDVCIDDEDRKAWDECKNGEERTVIARSPKYSPIYGDWKELCPIYLSASENESLVNDTKLIIDKCKEFGVDVEYDIDPYLLHGTVLFAGHIPEARDKLIIMIECMKNQLNK